MSTLGERLRRKREEPGISIAQAAAETRIAERYLTAIEAGDFRALPGAFFARSFIRQYAAFLGIDRHEIEAELGRIAGQIAPPLIPGQEPRKAGSDLPPIASYARPGANPRFARAVAALVGVVILCATVYALWLHRSQTTSIEWVARAHPEASTPAPPSPPVVPETPAAPTPEVSPAAVETRGPLWFQLTAEEPTWVDITSGGQRLYQGILEANQTKTISGIEQARLVVGNAGGLRIVSNGRPIGPLGARGQVRVVMLTPEGAQVLEPRRRSVEEAEPEAGRDSLRG